MIITLFGTSNLILVLFIHPFFSSSVLTNQLTYTVEMMQNSRLSWLLVRPTLFSPNNVGKIQNFFNAVVTPHVTHEETVPQTLLF